MGINKELQSLMNDVYAEGYIGGIMDDRWFVAYALAAKRILSEGVKFSDELVDEEYHKLINT